MIFRATREDPVSLSSNDDDEDVHESCEDESSIDPLATLNKSKDDNIVIFTLVPFSMTFESNNQPRREYKTKNTAMESILVP